MGVNFDLVAKKRSDRWVMMHRWLACRDSSLCFMIISNSCSLRLVLNIGKIFCNVDLKRFIENFMYLAGH